MLRRSDVTYNSSSTDIRHEAASLVDENTILVGAILGTSYTGE
jgi:hypothetical protein